MTVSLSIRCSKKDKIMSKMFTWLSSVQITSVHFKPAGCCHRCFTLTSAWDSWKNCIMVLRPDSQTSWGG